MLMGLAPLFPTRSEWIIVFVVFVFGFNPPIQNLGSVTLFFFDVEGQGQVLSLQAAC